jgi:hypothetical protein
VGCGDFCGGSQRCASSCVLHGRCLLRISHLAFCMEEVNQRDKGYHLVVKVVIWVSLKHEDRIFEGNGLNFEVCIF